ncbi:MAG: hypothetical protein HZB17_15240 [Chloroflexi bacterium]|nr:hypothetical protein [Chloroflexota bacterium]
MNKRIANHTKPVVSAQLRDNRITIEGACQELDQAPSGNSVREHLSESLDDHREAVKQLEQQINTALEDQVPPRVRRRWSQARYEMAIDLHDVPYHGQPALDENEVRRGMAKSGTTHFHSYATLAIVHNRRRYELAITFVWADESMADVVQRLIGYKNRLKVRVRRMYLDKGFCSHDVMAVLRRHRLPYIIPIPVRGKKDDEGRYEGGIGRLFVGQRSYYTRYTFNEEKEDAYTTDVAIVRTYSAGRYGRHRATWFAYAIYGVGHILPNQIFTLYRRRFGIESGYRQLEQVRARTASTSPALRLLLVGLALIILNAYMTVRLQWFTFQQYGSRDRRIWLTLRRLISLISHWLEQLFGMTLVQQQWCQSYAVVS